ncbi:NfeD family protein [Chloroflexota bacterium]
MNGELVTEFPDLWLWLIFVIIGLLLVLLELIVGVETGFDLVFIGSAFILGGLISWPFNSWLMSLVVTSLICIAYVFLGRKYVNRWTAVKGEKTNIDAIIGKQGTVLKNIAKNLDGQVQVSSEQWRARAEEGIKEGDEIVVTGISGNSLIVEKNKGGK